MKKTAELTVVVLLLLFCCCCCCCCCCFAVVAATASSPVHLCLFLYTNRFWWEEDICLENGWCKDEKHITLSTFYVAVQHVRVREREREREYRETSRRERVVKKCGMLAL